MRSPHETKLEFWRIVAREFTSREMEKMSALADLHAPLESKKKRVPRSLIDRINDYHA